MPIYFTEVQYERYCNLHMCGYGEVPQHTRMGHDPLLMWATLLLTRTTVLNGGMTFGKSNRDGEEELNS